MQKDKFNKYFDAVNDPISLLKQVRTGKISSEALEAVGSVHPELLYDMRQAVKRHMDEAGAKKLNYAQKLSLAKFLGEPLDESMMPKVIMTNQMALSGPSPSGPKNGQQMMPNKSNITGLKNMGVSDRSGTTIQQLERAQK